MCTDVWVVAGAKVGLCELPRALISSDDKGGTGGTCVLRGCVPKKLMALAGLFAEELQDASSFGCAVKLPGAMNSPTSSHTAGFGKTSFHALFGHSLHLPLM